MVGLIFFLAFGTFFASIIFVSKVVHKWAIENNKSPRLWSGFAGLCMLSIVFWDVFPVYGLHTYYCLQGSGLHVYKDPLQWRAENPRIAKTLTAIDERSIDDGDSKIYRLNQRFSLIATRSQYWYMLYQENQKVVDVETNETLFEKNDFYTDLTNPIVRPTKRLNDFKYFWMKIDSCFNIIQSDKWVVDGNSFSSYVNEFTHISGEIK
jgi:hypothetical protein